MYNGKSLVALAIVVLSALGSCGTDKVGANAPTTQDHSTLAFQVSVMPETYALGGSADSVYTTLEQSMQSDKDQVVVNIHVDGARDLKSVYLELKYDAQQYRAMVVQPTGLMGDAGDMVSMFQPIERGTIEYGQVLAHPDFQSGYSGSGIVAQARFTKEPELSTRTVSNSGPNQTTASQVNNLDFEGTTLTWTYYGQGDYDQNGETSISDLTPIARHLGQVSPGGGGTPWELTAVESLIDGDDNGEINISDVTPIGLNYQRDTSGGFHVFHSIASSDYPADSPPIGANGAGATELTPAAGVAVTAADNYAARLTERLRFTFLVAVPVANDFYWVRPADSLNVLGIASNIVIGDPAGAPTVSSTVPDDGAEGVAININPTATFSEAMNPATLSDATFTLLEGATPVLGSITSGGLTATFSPDSDLSPNTLYTATITTGAESLAGTALASNFVWTFETGATLDTTAPTVDLTVPTDGAVGVAINVGLSATFSETMNPATITDTTFTLMQGVTPVTGNVNYFGLVATFTPDGNLLESTVYTATVTTGANDLAGNPLASNYVWTFETGATLDTTAPTVDSTSPADADGGVAVNTGIAATFSEGMDPATISEATFTLMQGVTPVTGDVIYAGLVATFTPDSNLAENTEYTATITTVATDLAGNPLASDYVWTFTTALVDLGAAVTFGGFGGGAGMTNQGIFTVVDGDISTTGASTLITGFHDADGDVYTETPLNIGFVTGNIFTAPPFPGTAEQLAIATQAGIDAQIAFDKLSPASMPGGTDPGAGELGGLTLAPGVYQAAGGTFQITGSDLTLDGQGDDNAVWVFQCASSLTVGDTVPRSIILINGAQPKNVYWYVGSAATINGAGGGTMVGTIIASAGVTFSTAGNVILTVLDGRAIGLNASVTLVNTIINVPQ
jgi:Ice-binding-like/Bacterial Ig-like domain